MELVNRSHSIAQDLQRRLQGFSDKHSSAMIEREGGVVMGSITAIEPRGYGERMTGDLMPRRVFIRLFTLVSLSY